MNGDPTPKSEPDTTEPKPEPATATAQPESNPAEGSGVKAKAEPPKWEYRKNFKVVDRMKEIVNLTIDVSKAEIDQLRKRIDKLTYGS